MVHSSAAHRGRRPESVPPTVRTSIVAIGLLFFCWTACPAAAQFVYRTYPEIVAAIQAAETNYPNLCQAYNLGQTVQGREMWALRISDNVAQEEDEPEFRYISTMHGDEVTGVEMCLFLIDDLTSNYGIDPRITNIVDSIDIWIMPCMNPDGFVMGQRSNANGIDLNRNFPDPFSSPSNTPTGRAPETAAVMNWAFGQSFTLAANFHGGALVVNYPFDNNADGASVYTACPDDDLFFSISEAYTWENQPMWSGSFFHGITNGAEWYAISGGMQDWSYRYMGTNEVTIECSDIKTPPASQMPAFWNDNRVSMLAYMETSLMGVRGMLTDASSGQPIAGTVTVRGRDHEVYTDPDVGDYHRMLPPGTFEITASAAGYESLTRQNVVVGVNDATRWDAALGPPTMVVFPNGGEALPVGAPVNVAWSGNPGAEFHVQYTANADDFAVDFDDFEDGFLGGTYFTGGHQSWSVGTDDAHTGTHSAKSGPIGNNEVTWMRRTVNGANISFWYRMDSEAGGDIFTFYRDGNADIQASGTTGWTYYSVSVPPGSHTLLWEYAKDGGGTSGGDAVWIDDLEVGVDDRIWTDISPQTAQGATSTPWTPGETGVSFKIRARVENADGSHGAWDESDDRFEVSVGDTIPTLSEWGMMVMTLLALTAGSMVFRQRRHGRFSNMPI